MIRKFAYLSAGLYVAPMTVFMFLWGNNIYHWVEIGKSAAESIAFPCIVSGFIGVSIAIVLKNIQREL